MYDYDVIRSRRRTLAIEIDRNGHITVRAPFNVANYKIREFMEEKEDWIERSLKKMEERRNRRFEGDYGEEGNNGPETITDELPPLTESELKSLAEQAKIKIPARVEHFAKIIGVTYGRITIRTQKTRWGSCSSKGNLNFNCLLLRAPDEVLDYVVVHELCHRLEMNHSKNFWVQVERVCPEYKKRRKWLKDHGDELMAGLYR